MRQINPGLLGRWLTGQSLLGTVDGVNTTFTTARDFLHTADFKEAVYRRGQRLCEGTLPGFDYEAVESGGAGTGYDTIVFDFPPRVGDTLLIDYYPTAP